MGRPQTEIPRTFGGERDYLLIEKIEKFCGKWGQEKGGRKHINDFGLLLRPTDIDVPLYEKDYEDLLKRLRDIIKQG